MELTDSSEEVLPALLVGGTVGAVGGLALSRGLELTSGQVMFATNLALLGFGTSALAGALLDDDGEFDNGEMSALTLGLDGGALAGVLLAPKITWSAKRARVVGVASMAGFFAGSLAGAAFVDKNADGSSGDPDPDAVAVGVLAGMWGGFLLGVKLTDEYATDPEVLSQAAAAGDHRSDGLGWAARRCHRWRFLMTRSPDRDYAWGVNPRALAHAASSIPPRWRSEDDAGTITHMARCALCSLPASQGHLCDGHRKAILSPGLTSEQMATRRADGGCQLDRSVGVAWAVGDRPLPRAAVVGVSDGDRYWRYASSIQPASPSTRTLT